MTRAPHGIPQQKIEANGVDVSDWCIGSTVTRPENAISIAKIVLNDKNAVHFDGTFDEHDTLAISYKYSSQDTWKKVFEGQIEEPTAECNKQGKFTSALAYGYGRALLKTHCAQDYGLESSWTGYDTPYEIWAGLIAYQINKNFDSNNTGHAILNTKLKNVTSPTINFIKSDYRKSFDILNQTCLLVQADQAGSAGVHWFVDPSKNLWMDTIGSHSVDTTNWPTYWRTDAAGSTLVEGVDFFDYSFRIHVKDFANKIILITDLRKPGYDYWTEYAGAEAVTGSYLWGAHETGGNITLTDTNAAGYVIVGAYSLKCTINAGLTGYFSFPSSSLSGNAAAAQKDVAVTTVTNFKVGDTVTLWDSTPDVEEATIASIAGSTLTMENNLTNNYTVAANAHCFKHLGWDLSKIGSEKNPPTLEFYYYNDSNIVVGTTYVELATNPYFLTPDYYRTPFATNATAGAWHHISIPIGPYWKSPDYQRDYDWVGAGGAEDWTDINGINFQVTGGGGNGNLYLDDMHIGGKIIREAYNSTSIGVAGANKKEWQKVIKLDVSVDDSCEAADDTGVAAQLAYAELLHTQTLPTIGTITIAGAQDILPGQLVHVHAHKQLGGTYKIDANFRVKQITHEFGTAGFSTKLDLTSDVINTFAVGPNNSLSELARVQYVDPEAKSMKSTGVDALVTRLSKDYPS